MLIGFVACYFVNINCASVLVHATLFAKIFLVLCDVLSCKQSVQYMSYTADDSIIHVAVIYRYYAKVISINDVVCHNLCNLQ